ncbi:type III secretion system translocon subunit SctE [Providencia sp. CRE-3FA-0001]|uniref:Type III secretion system translocon subunit SctE n=5 Tax=Gammaproteobacteria TaxID=1236 RepID=A0AA42K325_9GAMM|nr:MULTISPECIES: type III secretion system translocon subunit SctE [Providencia]EJD6663857.1 type III secretion system translocon subunit SctE [Providencia rettgeri]ELR5077194.1 type III secretion system translocon subunit SctE [Providencia rettgeri]ELR5173466.1 type III secretion system translocon subunit SctE [Providencia rettgeri]ELR5196254.1 type III secretion system translocon subunit SctE [Providencia rettgeri]EMB8478879.1 type III secretion system translocon subunit SctE [Providencia re
MVDISNSGNSERIKNIHTFLKGENPLALTEDITKSVLVLEEACGALASTEQMKRSRAENSPQLNAPKMRAMAKTANPQGANSPQQEKSFNAKSLLIETFSTIRQLLHEGNISELSNKIKLLNVESESIREQGNILLDTFKKNTDALSSLHDQFEEQQKEDKTLRAELNSLNRQSDSLQEQFEQAGLKLQTAQEQLAEINELITIPPVNSTDAEDIEALNKLSQAKQSLTQTIEGLTNQSNTLLADKQQLNQPIATLSHKISLLNTQVLATAEAVTKQAEVAQQDNHKLNQFFENAPRRTDIDGDKWENTLALLTMLTAQLKKAMNEDSIRSMKEQEEVMMKISEASRKDSEKKAKEAAEAERKAAESNKAASCASKIFSYVLLAVSVIATVATFGTAAPLTLAIAAIGIAMAVADIVLEETGHGSLMQMLATEISSVVTDMLIEFGVDKDKAKQIGSIVGMIVAAVAFLAVSLLSMGSMIKNLVNTVKSAAKLLMKNVGTLLKNTIKAMPKSLTNALGNIANNTAKVSDSVADSADSMVKLSKLAKLSDKFDEAKHVTKAISQVVAKAEKSSDLVSIGGQMVKVSDSVADSADSMVKLSKLAKLSDKFDDVSQVAKTIGQVAAKVEKSSDLVSIGGQMVKVGDSVVDSAGSVAKLTKFTKLADKVDDVKDTVKTVEKTIDKAKKIEKVKNQSVAMAKVEVVAKGSGAALTVASAATTGGLNLHAASMGEKMKEMLAGMMLNNAAIEAITELLNQLIKAMSKNYEQFDEMFTTMLNGLQQSSQSKVDMMKTARYA